MPNEESPEFHFEELKQIILQLENNSPLLSEESEVLSEYWAKVLYADSAQKAKLGLSFQGQSIFEDRPSQDYFQRYRFFGSAYLRKPVFHWGALEASSEIAMIREGIAKESFRNFLSELRTLTRDSYLDILILSEEVSLKKKAIRNARSQLEEAIEKREVKLSNLLQVEEANVALLAKQIELEDLNRSLSIALKQFAETSGWDALLLFEEKNDSFAELNEKYEFDGGVPTLLSAASSSRFRRLEKEILVESKNILIAESELKPKVNFVGGFFQDQVPLADNRDSFVRNNALVGLEVNWEIWDGARSKASKLQSLARKRRLELSLQRESEAFRVALENMRMELQSLAKRVRLSRDLVKVSQKRYAMSKADFESKKITQSHLLDAQIAFERAKLDRMQSVCNFLKLRNKYDEMASIQ